MHVKKNNVSQYCIKYWTSVFSDLSFYMKCFETLYFRTQIWLQWNFNFSPSATVALWFWVACPDSYLNYCLEYCTDTRLISIAGVGNKKPDCSTELWLWRRKCWEPLQRLTKEIFSPLGSPNLQQLRELRLPPCQPISCFFPPRSIQSLFVPLLLALILLLFT